MDTNRCTAPYDCGLLRVTLAAAFSNHKKAGAASVSDPSVKPNKLDKVLAQISDTNADTINHFIMKMKEFNSLNFDTFNATNIDRRANQCHSLAHEYCSCTKIIPHDKATFYSIATISKSDDINLKNTDENTPLHIWAMFRDLFSYSPHGSEFFATYGYYCNFIIENGSDVTIKNKQKETALDIALSHNNRDLVKRLIHGDSLLPINARNLCFFLLFVERNKNYLSAGSESSYNPDNATFPRIIELVIVYSIEQAIAQGNLTKAQLSECFDKVDAKVKELNEASLVHPFSIPLILGCFRKDLDTHSKTSPEALKSICKRSFRKILQKNNLTLKNFCTRVCNLNIPNNLKPFLLGVSNIQLELLRKMFEKRLFPVSPCAVFQ